MRKIPFYELFLLSLLASFHGNLVSEPNVIMQFGDPFAASLADESVIIYDEISKKELGVLGYREPLTLELPPGSYVISLKYPSNGPLRIGSANYKVLPLPLTILPESSQGRKLTVFHGGDFSSPNIFSFSMTIWDPAEKKKVLEKPKEVAIPHGFMGFGFSKPTTRAYVEPWLDFGLTYSDTFPGFFSGWGIRLRTFMAMEDLAIYIGPLAHLEFFRAFKLGLGMTVNVLGISLNGGLNTSGRIFVPLGFAEAVIRFSDQDTGLQLGLALSSFPIYYAPTTGLGEALLLKPFWDSIRPEISLRYVFP